MLPFLEAVEEATFGIRVVATGTGMDEYGVEFVRCLFFAGASDEGRGIEEGLEFCAETVAFANSAAAEGDMLCVLRRFVSICDSFWRPGRVG